LNSYEQKLNLFRDYTLINRWSISSVESYPLWKIYLGGSKSGVAMRSTVSKLKKAIDGRSDSFNEDIFVGRVNYKDYIPEPKLTRFNLITIKNAFYKSEEEMRLFILNEPMSDKSCEFNRSMQR
jgi:hypothetical protein